LRVIAGKDGNRVRLYSRPGNDLTKRFPLIVESLARLRSRSCVIDGEAVACGDDGIASFDRIRYRRHDGGVFLYAFDLIELDGAGLRATRSRCERPRSRASSRDVGIPKS
jgi:bifunctional non-homologous end joining protein LigD